MKQFFVSMYTDGPATRWNVIDRRTQDRVGIFASEKEAYEFADKRNSKSELERLKNRIDSILNNVLVDMKPGWDDSIEGFNKAWDITRDIFKEEIDRASR